MKLEQCVELMHRSTGRMVSALADPARDNAWWVFMRREAWHQLKLSIMTFWKIFWRSRSHASNMASLDRRGESHHP